MKLLLKVLPTLALAELGFAAQAQISPMHGSKTKFGLLGHKLMMPNGTVMKDGKMMLIRDGKMMAMNEDMTMSDGSMCMRDGMCKMKDGTMMKMQEGDMMAMNGTMTHHGDKGKSRH